MEGSAIKVKIRRQSNVLTEFEKSHSPTLPGLIEALDNVKKSINDFLTDLIDSSETNQPQTTNKNTNEEEEDEIPEDPLSEVLNQMTAHEEVESVKRKSTRNRNAKRLKR